MLMLAGNLNITQYMEIKTNINLWGFNTDKSYQKIKEGIKYSK